MTLSPWTFSPHRCAMRGMADYRRVLADNVKAARKALGLSQEALALETEIDRTYISGIERGLRNPSLDLIVRLGARLHKTPSELLALPERKPRR